MKKKTPSKVSALDTKRAEKHGLNAAVRARFRTDPGFLELFKNIMQLKEDIEKKRRKTFTLEEFAEILVYSMENPETAA